MDMKPFNQCLVLLLSTGKISSQLSFISATIESIVRTPNEMPIGKQLVEMDVNCLDKDGAESVCGSPCSTF